MPDEKAIIIVASVKSAFKRTQEGKAGFYFSCKQCVTCSETVAGLIFDASWNIKYDARAVVSVLFQPLTRIVFGIHNNLFYRWYKRSMHFLESAHYVYICEKCAENIADRVVMHIPEIKDRYLLGEIINDPVFDPNAEGENEKGCWITVEEFTDLSKSNGGQFLNYQTNLKNFDKIISSIGTNLEKII